MKKLLILCFLFPIFLSAQHTDISGVVAEYKGAESCVVCHPAGSKIDIEAIAKKVVNSGHFQFKKDVENSYAFRLDGDDDLSNDQPITGSWGKANRYCGVPGAIPSIAWIGLMQNPNPPFNANNPAYPNGMPGGCSRCHISNGTVPPNKAPDENTWKSVDCLLCHAETYRLNGVKLNNYGARKPITDTTSATGMRMPIISGDDLSATSQSITKKPTTENCQNCHVWAGGGYTNKRGYDYTGKYGSNEINDVHATNVTCVDCHITKDHMIGMGRIKPAVYVNDLKDDPDNDKISCAFCHSKEGQDFFTQLTIPIPEHKTVPPNHFNKIDCQVCHINNNQGLDQKWFNQIVRELDENGRFKRWKPKGHKVSGQNTLLYKWFNGTVYEKVRPRGAKDDDNSKLHPFRYMQSLIPIDDATGLEIPIKLGLIFNADSTISNLSAMGITDEESLVKKAIAIGARDAINTLPDVYAVLKHDENGNYTGTYSWHEDMMNFSVDHGTSAKSEAKQCVDCHADSGGILDWQELGYEKNPYVITDVKGSNSSLPNEYALHQNYPNPFNPTTTIKFDLASRSSVKLQIFNSVGELVETLVDNSNMAPGKYSVNFNTNSSAQSLSSGVYFYKITAGNFVKTNKMILLK